MGKGREKLLLPGRLPCLKGDPNNMKGFIYVDYSGRRGDHMRVGIVCQHENKRKGVIQKVDIYNIKKVG